MAKLTSVSLNGNSSDVADAYSKSETDTLLAGKQATLTPGSGINISSNNVISATGGSGVNLYDAPLDSNGNVHTGGAITPTGLVNALYSTNGGVNITGALKDGETTTTRSDNIVIGRGNTTADSINNIMIGFGHQAPSGGITGHSAVMVGTDISSGIASVGVGGAMALGMQSVGVGGDISAENLYSIALGEHATADGVETISIGCDSYAYNANHDDSASSDGEGSIAIGAGAVATANGVLSIGHAAGDTRSSGGTFRNALRRRIVNVADGTNATDAATKGQLDAAIASLQAQIDALRS